MSGPRESGYTFTLGPVEYVGMRGQSVGFSLVECWRAVYGVGGAAIYAPNGRLVLANAGSLSARAAHVAQARRPRRWECAA